MFRTSIAAALLAVTFAAAPVHAGDFTSLTDGGTVAAAPAANSMDAQERLMIVNRNTGRVIYDDGRSDLFCSTRVYIAGYTDWGRPIYRRNMRCR
jgi:hypothetical protein